MKILVLLADQKLSESVWRVATQLGHEVHVVRCNADALRSLRCHSTEVVILDWDMPVMNSVTVIRWACSQRDSPVGLIFSRDNVLEMEQIETVGGQVLWPDVGSRSLDSLVQQMNALLRTYHVAEPRDGTLQLGACVLEEKRRAVRLHELDITLTPKEFELVSLLFRNVGRIVARDMISSVVWGDGRSHSPRSIDTHMSRIRTKLSFGQCATGLRLVSVYSLGYRLDVLSADEHVGGAA